MNFKFDTEMQQQFKILDLYDFTPYLEEYDDIRDLIDNFEYDHNFDVAVPSEWNHCILNYCDTETLVDYLKVRYPQYYFAETTTYKIWRTK